MESLQILYTKWLAACVSKGKSFKKWASDSGSKLKPGLRFDRPKSVEDLPEKMPSFLLSESVKSRPFLPLLKVIKKSKKSGGQGWKKRPICYASHLDSLIFSWYSFLLENSYEDRLLKSGLTKSVIGYRKTGLSTVDHATGLFEKICDGTSWCVVALDIHDFYGSLRHNEIKRVWSDLLGTSRLPDDHYAVFQALTSLQALNKNSVSAAMRKAKIKPPRGMFCRMRDLKVLIRQGLLAWEQSPKLATKVGIPQGLAISPLIANAYMFTFDQRVSAQIGERGGFYLRYADDILIAVPSGPNANFDIPKFVELQLVDLNLGLSLSQPKTQIRLVSMSPSGIKVVDGDGVGADIDYLGLVLDKFGIKIRKKTMTRFGHRIRRGAHRVSKGYASRSKVLRSTRLGVSTSNYLRQVDLKIALLKSSILKKSVSNDKNIHRARRRIFNAHKKFNKKAN